MNNGVRPVSDLCQTCVRPHCHYSIVLPVKMKVEITKLPKSEIELKIEVPAEEWQEFLDTAARELSKDLKIEGFRPGFAPLKLVEERI